MTGNMLSAELFAPPQVRREALARTVHFSIVETSAGAALAAVREELRERGA